MTQQTPPKAWRGALTGATDWVRQRLAGSGTRIWLGVIALVIVLGLIAISVNAMVTPAIRLGNPATTVAPLPVTTPTATPESAEASMPTPSSATQSVAPKPKLPASGEFAAASLSVPPLSSSGQKRSYAVRVETSLKLKPKSLGNQVAGLLNDPRSWTGSGSIRFGLIPKPKDADFQITLAAPATAKKLCDPGQAGVCTAGAEVVVDAASWQTKPADYATKAEWQAYLVNHGVGLLMGEREARCPKKAKPAPVMMVQSGDLGGCLANPWPYP